MSEQVKTEGSFKIKSKPKLTEEQIGAQNKEPLVDIPSNMTRVVIPNQETDAIQEPSAEKVDVDAPAKDGPTMVTGTSEPGPAEVTEEIKEKVIAQPTQLDLPENIGKLVDFMKETGGTMQDYIRLSTNYDDIDQDTLVREYYKNTKSHLTAEEVNFMIEDNFAIDEDIDEDREVRRKKLAYKEEVAKARTFLKDTKEKYYDDIKLKSPNLSRDQQEASDFFNRYNNEQELAQQQHERFIDTTKQLLNDDFKGFDFEVGEKKFKYGVKDPSALAENQSNLNNFVGKFLDNEGNVKDTKGYHKAMYAASNIDKIGNHFYEQGKSDGIKNVVQGSKNPDSAIRQTQGDIYIGGLKVRAIDGVDSSKLKIKKSKFNN